MPSQNSRACTPVYTREHNQAVSDITDSGPTEYLAPNKVAEILGVHHTTVRRQIKSGKLKAFKIGSAIRVPRSALEGMLEPIAPSAGSAND